MLKKIEIMIEEDQYCGDIAQQINATIGLLKKMNTDLLKSHLVCCGTSKLQDDNSEKVDEFVDEFFRLIGKY